jgi:hypothetical protein
MMLENSRNMLDAKLIMMERLEPNTACYDSKLPEGKTSNTPAIPGTKVKSENKSMMRSNLLIDLESENYCT